METEKHPVLARLEEAARGLTYQSETGAPVEPFLLPTLRGDTMPAAG